MRSGALLLLVVFISGTTQAAENLNQFAYGTKLTLDANQLYEFEVPSYIYQHSQQQHLLDVRIFDADGNEMAQTITETQHRTSTTHKQAKNLTFFPVSGPLLTVQPQSQNPVNMHIKRDDAGIIVDIYNDQPATKNNNPTYYLVDLGESKSQNLRELFLSWIKSEQITATVTIDTSNDLQNWHTAGKGVIFYLNNGKQLFNKNRVSVKGANRYLKIGIQSDATFALKSIQAIFEDNEEQQAPLRWTKATLISQNNNHFEYDVPTGYLFTALRVTPTGDNVLLHIQLTRSSDGKKWQRHYEGNIYQLKVGDQQYNSDPIVGYSNFVRWPHWRVDIISSNQPHNQAPEIELGWYPQKLRFLTNSAGIYTVAFGSKLVRQTAPSIPALIRTDNSIVKPVNLPETIFEIGGDTAMHEPIDASVVKKSVLWVVMSLVLLAMGYMAYRTVKSMNAQDRVE